MSVHWERCIFFLKNYDCAPLIYGYTLPHIFLFRKRPYDKRRSPKSNLFANFSLKNPATTTCFYKWINVGTGRIGCDGDAVAEGAWFIYKMFSPNDDINKKVDSFAASPITESWIWHY